MLYLIIKIIIKMILFIIHLLFITVNYLSHNKNKYRFVPLLFNMIPSSVSGLSGTRVMCWLHGSLQRQLPLSPHKHSLMKIICTINIICIQSGPSLVPCKEKEQQSRLYLGCGYFLSSSHFNLQYPHVCQADDIWSVTKTVTSCLLASYHVLCV